MGLVLLSFIVAAVKADIQFIHQSWMSLFFPHQHGRGHPVLGKYRPQETWKLVFYWVWAIVGVPISIVVYPFVILGFIIRLTTIRLSRTAARLGILGVVVIVGVLWGVLSLLAYFQLETNEFLALSAAAVVATVAAAIAVLGHDNGGRGLTVLIAYPASVTAIFLPPIVAALLWEPLGDIILPQSELLAVFILDDILFVFGLNDIIRDMFDLDGVGFIGMWLAISLVIGWILGILVSLADVVRPRAPEEGEPYGR